MKYSRSLSTCLLFFLLFRLPALCQVPARGFSLYEDKNKELTAAAAFHLLQAGKFSYTEKLEQNKGFTKSVYWLAYINPVDLPVDSLVMEIGHSHINIIHFYFGTDSTIKEQWVTGDYFPFSQRPVRATNFYFPVDKKGVYLARIDKSNESLQLSFGLIGKTAALASERDDKMIMALFTGMILLLIIFGIYLFIIRRETLYLYYILYIGSGWLWVLSNAGYGFEYLWPNQAWFASKARPVFAITPLIFSVMFLFRYIGGVDNRKIVNSTRILNIVLIACILTILLFNVNGYQSSWWLYIQYFIPLISLIYILVIMGILIVNAIRGNTLAMFYLTAISVLMGAGILQASFSLGTVGGFSRFFSNYGLAVGYVLEAIILTAGLVYRFNQYRLEKENLLRAINQQQLENTRLLMEAQASERNQVANQLHDVAGSLLSAAKLNLSSLREKEPLNSAAGALAEKAEEAVGLVSDMVRNLSHALSPVMLDKVGFKASLEKIVGIVNAPGKLNVRLLVIGFETYEPSLGKFYHAGYSIIYELLNNLVKHAGASHALIQVVEHPDSLAIVVEDNGTWTKDSKTMIDSQGMMGIKSKINYFGGSLAFDQNEPSGLIVTIEIPLIRDSI
jgi:signal transduction histidine kinase